MIIAKYLTIKWKVLIRTGEYIRKQVWIYGFFVTPQIDDKPQLRFLKMF